MHNVFLRNAARRRTAISVAVLLTCPDTHLVWINQTWSLRQLLHRSPSCNNMSPASSRGHLGLEPVPTRTTPTPERKKDTQAKPIFPLLIGLNQTQFFLNQLNKQTMTFQSDSVHQQSKNKTCLKLKLDQCISWPQETAISTLVWLPVQSRDLKWGCGFFIPTRIKQTKIFGFFWHYKRTHFMLKNINANYHLRRR